jgi:multiple sugar transport system ATP-binding protein
LHVEGDGFALPLSDGQRKRLEGYGSREVQVGIRPSSFIESDAPEAIRMPVILSEYIGAQSILISELGRTRVSIEVNSLAPVKAGEVRSFLVQGDEVHLFDPVTEAAL